MRVAVEIVERYHELERTAERSAGRTTKVDSAEIYHEQWWNG